MTPRAPATRLPNTDQSTRALGLLTQVGRGALSPCDVVRILAAAARDPRTSTAPARGLCLERIFYDFSAFCGDDVPAFCGDDFPAICESGVPACSGRAAGAAAADGALGVTHQWAKKSAVSGEGGPSGGDGRPALMTPPAGRGDSSSPMIPPAGAASAGASVLHAACFGCDDRSAAPLPGWPAVPDWPSGLPSPLAGVEEWRETN